jgi:hypothetical protein
MQPAAPDNRKEPTSPPPDLRTLSQQLEARLARREAAQRPWQEQEAAQQEAHVEATQRQAQEAQTPPDPEAIRARIKAEAQTTPADLQHMLGRDRYPT